SHTANSAEEAAPFVCFCTAPESEDPVTYYLDEPECQAAWSAETPMTTQEAVKAGYAVVDGGATKTLGSVTAIENILAINNQKWGKDKLKGVDRDNRPLFGFGNSTENRCLSTIKLGVQAGAQEGELSVHALGQGSGPVLLSVDTLRRLKAVIDFDSDLAVFRALDDSRVLKLARPGSAFQAWMCICRKSRDNTSHHRPLTGNGRIDGFVLHYTPVESLQTITPEHAPVQDRQQLLQADPLFSNVMSTAPVTKGAIEKMNKGQLQTHLQKLGEECPSQWGKAEIKARIYEVMEDLGEEIPSGRTRPPLATMMTEMNKASRKKAELVTYAEDKLGLMISPNMTIRQIQNAAIRKIYDLSPATDMDPVGFGRHSALTYGELMTSQPDYCKWVRTTADENGKESDYRLQRLAGWLENQTIKDQGEKIKQLMMAMEMMKEQMEALTPEPRRKKTEAMKSEGEITSPESFSMVSSSGKGQGHKS
ncbi:unnamed protein product, partial [Symbiodinium necroappetens]